GMLKAPEPITLDVEIDTSSIINKLEEDTFSKDLETIATALAERLGTSLKTALGGLDSLTSGWLTMWEAVGAGQNVMKSFGQMTKNVIADVAKLMAKEEMARAAGAFAQAI